MLPLNAQIPALRLANTWKIQQSIRFIYLLIIIILIETVYNIRSLIVSNVILLFPLGTCATPPVVLVSTSIICTVVGVLGVLLFSSVLSNKCSSNQSLIASSFSCAVFLSLLLLVCVLWLLFWKNQSKKTVAPGSQSDSESESSTGGSISCPTQRSDGEKEPWHSEVVWRTFTGFRTVKSAHAALCSSPSGAAAVKELEQNEAQPRVKNTEGKREEEIWDGVVIEMENKINIPDESPPDCDNDSAGITEEALPYLSIGMNLSGGDEQVASRQGQRSTAGKVMRRVSTWPPTAVEWQARRKRVEEQEGSNVEKEQSCQRHLEEMEGVAQREGEGKLSDAQLDGRHSHTSNPPDEGAIADVLQQKEETHEDQASDGRMRSKTTSAAAGRFAPAAKAEKSTRRNEANAAEKRGVTPNDETLLSGNEYVFVDLLHEVVQNNGRWTRERWKQSHSCKKPERKDRGADTRLK